MASKITWALIANNRGAKIAEHQGAVAGYHIIRNWNAFLEDRPSWGARRQDGSPFGKSALKEYENVQAESIGFVRDVASFLAKRLSEHKFDRLIIASSPEMLEKLHDALPQDVTGTVVGEIKHDLTRLPDQELSKAFQSVTLV